MKILIKINLFILLVTCSLTGLSQNIEVSGGLGEYDQAEYPGYPLDGIFYASLNKGTGTIPAGTIGFSISLVPEIGYTGQSFELPEGWVLQFSSPTALYIVNENVDWTTNEIFVLIPVKTTQARSDGSVSLRVTYDNIGGDWVDPVQNNNFTRSAVTVIDNVLPVTLTSFKAVKESATTFLKWSTTSESNSNHFEVQRSKNGKNWNKIGQVASNGESSDLKNYSFTDPTPTAGENLYRLKMVDLDGTFAYSQIQSLTFEKNIQAFAYPNPATDKLLIKDFTDVKQVMLHNMSGVTVLTTERVAPEGIDVKHLESGMYILSMTRSDGTLYTNKVVIAK